MTMSTVAVRVFAIGDNAAADAAFALRRVVFVEEQNVPEREEFDGRDADCLHLLAEAEDRPLATLRLREAGDCIKIERVCVAADARGRGVGDALMQTALKEIAARHPNLPVRLGAQLTALEFYARLGFVAYGPDYIDAGIWHRDMELRRG